MRQTSPMTTSADLLALVDRALPRAMPPCPTGIGAAARSPITGDDLLTLGSVDAAGHRGRDRPIARGVPGVAERARARARRPGQAVRPAARGAQGRPRRSGHDRGRQDPLRGARRGPGDDRHLRLRRRPVAPARRPHDALRAPRPPADGDLAPARRGRRHLRVQLPGRRLGLEHGHRPGLRRHGHLEAVRADAAHVAGLLAPCSTGRIAESGAPADVHQVVITDRDSAAPLLDDPRVALVSATGSERMGARSVHASPPASAPRCSSSAATTPPSSRRRRTSTWPCAASSSRQPAPRASAAPSMRRVIAHASIVDELVDRLAAVYGRLPIGDPLDGAARWSAR